jgi:hypothetical protein
MTVAERAGKSTRTRSAGGGEKLVNKPLNPDHPVNRASTAIDRNGADARQNDEKDNRLRFRCTL